MQMNWNELESLYLAKAVISRINLFRAYKLPDKFHVVDTTGYNNVHCLLSDV